MSGMRLVQFLESGVLISSVQDCAITARSKHQRQSVKSLTGMQEAEDQR